MNVGCRQPFWGQERVGGLASTRTRWRVVYVYLFLNRVGVVPNRRGRRSPQCKRDMYGKMRKGDEQEINDNNAQDCD